MDKRKIKDFPKLSLANSFIRKTIGDIGLKEGKDMEFSIREANQEAIRDCVGSLQKETLYIVMLYLMCFENLMDLS